VRRNYHKANISTSGALMVKEFAPRTLYGKNNLVRLLTRVFI
jgi:hypothetical protein